MTLLLLACLAALLCWYAASSGVLSQIVTAPQVDYRPSVHATVKHGIWADRVRQCIDNGGTQQIWLRPDDNRWLRLCEVNPGYWGIQVLEKVNEKWEEVTAYVRQRPTSLAKLSQILGNQGAKLVWFK